jgi:uncharacterized protein YndB with AHSA1/START domain/DNA-binding transcriptional ArsR family regulator
MDEVFRALADPGRRRLLDRLREHGGQTLSALCAGAAITRQSISKHLAVLEAAGLVTTLWRGREKLHFLNAAPIQELSDRWLRPYDRPRAQALSDLRRQLEGTPVEEDAFVYVTYIATTPERLWQALTDPAFTARYWGVTFESDWQVGSPLSWQQRGVRFADGEQVVLAYEPHRRLAYTWHTFTPEFGATFGFPSEVVARWAAERRSKVTFEIEPMGAVVKLTVIHDAFEPGSEVLQSVRQGWPMILSALKTLLETGDLPPGADQTTPSSAG